VPGRVGALFAQNGGVVTAKQLKQLGFSENGIRRLIRSGALVPQRKGVYTSAEFAAQAERDPASKHALELAAVLASTDAACAGSHWTAAIVLGLDLLAEPPSGLVALTQAPGGTGSRASRPGVKLHVAELPETDVVLRYGVLVTSSARTVVDIARSGTFEEGVAVAGSALRAGQTEIAELEAVLAACAQWPGLQRARSVVSAVGREGT
jgi:Transcriptional regulator, AbiEi antitoxin